jgi:transcriptional regulator with XRE-family HTH domain
LIRNLKRTHAWAYLAEKTGYTEGTLSGVLHGHFNASYRMAIEVARVAGVSIDQILNGGMVSADRCPTCHQPWPEK